MAAMAKRRASSMTNKTIGQIITTSTWWVCIVGAVFALYLLVSIAGWLT